MTTLTDAEISTWTVWLARIAAHGATWAEQVPGPDRADWALALLQHARQGAIKAGVVQL